MQNDGKQVRDVLYVTDLVNAFDAFVQKKDIIHHGVYNIGGGVENTLSLLELIDILEDETGKRAKIKYDKWRKGDQKVYISDISKAKKKLNWKPKISPKEGVKDLFNWVLSNEELFEK